jgi:sugar transferase (PEP-CTERM/EpsH1 system associated)
MSAPLVMHVIHRLAIGGLENGLVNLVNRMSAERYRHAIVCLTDYTDFRLRIMRPDVEVHALHKRHGQDLGVYGRFWKLLRALRPAIVHTRNFGALEFQWIAAIAGVRGRVHGEHGWDAPDLHGTNRRHLRLRRMTRPLIRRYVPMSRDLAAWLRRAVGVPEARIAQLYSGVDTERFRPGGPESRAVLPAGFADANSIVIGTVGRLEAVKNQGLLAEAFIQLARSRTQLRPHLRLVVVGDGPLHATMNECLKGSGFASQAWFAGARNDVDVLVRAMDVFALTSLNEGISNTILEAMASGLPVVATDVGGNRELVEAEVTGSLVPLEAPALATALGRYAASRELRLEHGGAARRRVQANFSLATMVAGYQGVYDAMLAKRSD